MNKAQSVAFIKRSAVMARVYDKAAEVKRYVYGRLSAYFPRFVCKLVYKKMVGKPLNLKNPKDFNEKIQWLKLYYYPDNELIIRCADKYRVREYIKSCGCAELLNPLYGVYDSPEEIDWNSLPEKFALKFNTAAGYNIICKDKNILNEAQVKATMRKWFSSPKGESTVERHYCKIEPKIICEAYIPGLASAPIDYKIYCFHGEPRFILLCVNRDVQLKMIAVDKDFNNLHYVKDDYTTDRLPPKPKTIDAMLHYAKILSAPFPFVRVDLYDVHDKVLFGELTFSPTGGYCYYYPDEILLKLGSLIDLSKCVPSQARGV